MQKIVIGFVLAVIVLVSGCTGPKQQSTTNGVSGTTVDIKGFAFEPNTITVKSGTTVIWTNGDSTPHTITGSNFDSGSISQGSTFSQTFKEAGTFDYHCAIHSNMQGKVIVT